MSKEKVTRSFEIDSGKFCGDCSFKMYVHHSDYYVCKIFDKKLRKQRKDIYIELLRCQKCKTASVPVKGEQEEKQHGVRERK